MTPLQWTLAHVLQDCPLQDIPTLAAWPEETSRTAHSRTSRDSQRGQRRPPPEGEAVRRPCGPEEDGVVLASHWRGRLEKPIEEEEEEVTSLCYIIYYNLSADKNWLCFKLQSRVASNTVIGSDSSRLNQAILMNKPIRLSRR